MFTVYFNPTCNSYLFGLSTRNSSKAHAQDLSSALATFIAEYAPFPS